MDITSLLGSDLGKQALHGITQKTEATEEETSSVLSAATPVLLGMLKKNSETPEGASGLLGALNKHDGSVLNNLGGFLNANDTSDGQAILGHILGGQKGQVENAISAKTGVSTSKVTHILALLAPIILGKLGSQANSNSVSSGDGLSNILGGLLGGADSSSIGGGILSSILGGSGQQGGAGGIGSVLGGLFGKK